MLKPRKDWLALSALALCVAFLTLTVDTLAPDLVPSGAYAILLFFFLLTLVTHYASVASIEAGHQQFTLVFFGLMTFRLLTTTGIVLVVLLKNLPQKIPLIVYLGFTYLVFLIFEINALLTTLRSNFQKRADNAEKSGN